MNKQDLIQNVAEEVGLSKTDVKKVVDAVFEHIKDDLSQGNESTFVGFGTFKISHRKARAGRNPQTGEPLDIKASKSVGFKAGKALKEAVN